MENSSTSSTFAQPSATLPAAAPQTISISDVAPWIPKEPPSLLLSSLEERLPSLEFEVNDLDRIADGIYPVRFMERIDSNGCYMCGFLFHFDFWIRVSEELAHCLQGTREDSLATNSKHQEFTRKLKEHEIAVLSRFPAAHLAEPAFLEYDAAPKMDLLKAYRGLTRFLSSTALGLWPEAERQLSWLTQHA